MAILRQLFILVVIIFQTASNNLMPLYYPFPFGRSIIVVQVNSSGIIPYHKVSCAILTKSSHLSLFDFFSRVDSLIHIFIFSDPITEGPPDLPA